MRRVGLCITLFFIAIGFSLNVHAGNSKYYRFLNSDINGNKFAYYPLQNPEGYKIYYHVFYDNQGRIEKYQSYWKGTLYSTITCFYNGKDTRLLKTKFVSRKYSGITKYYWSGKRCIKRESYDMDGTMTSYSTIAFPDDLTVEIKGFKKGDLISHSRYHFSDPRTVDYSEHNLSKYKKWKNVYQKSPNIVTKIYTRFGEKDWVHVLIYEYDNQFLKKYNVIRRLKNSKKISESFYKNGIKIKSVNYQRKYVMKYIREHDVDDMLSSTRIYADDKYVCKLDVIRSPKNGSIIETVGYLPEGKIFARYPNKVITAIREDGSPINGGKYTVFQKPQWN